MNLEKVSLLKASVAATLLGSSIGAYGAVRVLSEVPPWVQKLIENQGSDFLVIVVFLGGLIIFGPSFIKSQQDMAVAFGGIKDQLQAMNAQAGKLDEIKGLLEDLILNQHVIVDRLRNIEVKHAREAEHEC